MSGSATPMSRPLVGVLALALVAGVLALDAVRTPAPDLFAAPPPLALGSGQAPAGAHCSGG